MTAISITDLNNAKIDVDHIADVSTSVALTSTDRLGHVKDTVTGAMYKVAAFNSRGAWTATTGYAIKDLVSNSGTWYVCVAAHTSSAAFATDTASKWRVYQGVTSGDLAASSGASLVGYMPSGVGAIATDVQAKLRESVSILDFGAVGDGVTDDTVNMQKAIDYALQVGGKLTGTPGYFRTTASLNIGLPFYTANDLSFIVNRTSPISDAVDIAAQNAANKAANVSKKKIDFVGEAGFYIVADFAPAVHMPVLAYNLDNDSFDNTGSIRGVSVIAANQMSGGVFNPSATYATNNLIGVYAGRGCSVSEKLFFAGLGSGFVSNRTYWSAQRDMKANHCGIGFNFSNHNQAKASQLNAHTCLTGYIFDAQNGELSGFGTENCDTDAWIMSADCCDIGPAYLEDVRTSGGAGESMVKLGYSADSVQITHTNFNSILTLCTLGSLKKGWRFWSVASSVLQTCRSYGSGYTIDGTSYGRALNCDFTPAGTLWRGDFTSLLVDETAQANSSVATFGSTGITRAFPGAGNGVIDSVAASAGRGGAMCLIRGVDYATGASFCFIYPVAIKTAAGSGSVIAGTPSTAAAGGISFTFSVVGGLVRIGASGLGSGGEWYVSFFGM